MFGLVALRQQTFQHDSLWLRNMPPQTLVFALTEELPKLDCFAIRRTVRPVDAAAIFQHEQLQQFLSECTQKIDRLRFSAMHKPLDFGGLVSKLGALDTHKLKVGGSCHGSFWFVNHETARRQAACQSSN